MASSIIINNNNNNENKEDDFDDDPVVAEVANGWNLRPEASPSTLSEAERARFAISPNETYRKLEIEIDVSSSSKSKSWQGIVPGGEAWTNGEEVRSPWAVWTTGSILSPSECDEWIRRGQTLEFETGDFIFAGNSKQELSRLPTGARRHSATRLVEDPGFARDLGSRLQGLIPPEILGGRKYAAIGDSFLVSRYQPGQYFAPHFDGRGSGFGDGRDGCSEFTVVLYLSDDFVGGATHYLSGQGSEVQQSVAVRPARGCACIHRQGSVLHAGGAVEKGTKYIMQFMLHYESPKVPEPRPMTNLRWGA